jgi:hypothetical protein
MNTQVRAKYQAPKLEVQRLHELPSALAQSGCRISEGHPSCSTSGTGNQPTHSLSSYMLPS